MKAFAVVLIRAEIHLVAAESDFRDLAVHCLDINNNDPIYNRRVISLALSVWLSVGNHRAAKTSAKRQCADRSSALFALLSSSNPHVFSLEDPDQQIKRRHCLL